MIRTLLRDEIGLIWTIDRSEVHHHIYRVVEGQLILEPAYFAVPGWDQRTIPKEMLRLQDCFDRGGIFRGEFESDALVGVSVLDTTPVASARDHLQLVYLYVSRPVRGRGIGSKLLADAADAARGLGAKALYISATPTENTVNFYLRRGSALLDEPDPDLLASEPNDIHLTYTLETAQTARRA